jgi:perosamine synthetase
MRAMEPKASRRGFLAAATAAAVAPAHGESGKPALLGGAPLKTTPFPAWPVAGAPEEDALASVLHSGNWFRGSGRRVTEFEEQYAALTGARFCVATANGTSALFAALNALDVGPGDEVLVPPYTFVATVNAVLLQHALPVFIDTDRETFQMDARKIEARITPQTRVVLPVHLGGSAVDLDSVLEVARRKRLRVLEDACQAHLGEWKQRKLGTWGDCGCFSFQASKNLNSGEGGALITNDEALFDRAFAFHGNGRARKGAMGLSGYASNGSNLRLTEFQGALLTAQMTRLEAQSKRRDENAAYLRSLLSELPGIHPQKMYSGCTRNAWHLFMLRYDAGEFAGLPRARFLKALSAEGVPCSGGYTPLNKEAFLERVLGSRHYQRLYGDVRLVAWRQQNECPENDRLCREAVWFTQTMLLGTRSDMEEIAAAIRKIRTHASELAAGA